MPGYDVFSPRKLPIETPATEYLEVASCKSQSLGELAELVAGPKVCIDLQENAMPVSVEDRKFLRAHREGNAHNSVRNTTHVFFSSRACGGHRGRRARCDRCAARFAHCESTTTSKLQPPLQTPTTHTWEPPGDSMRVSDSRHRAQGERSAETLLPSANKPPRQAESLAARHPRSASRSTSEVNKHPTPNTE
jgi:hypothetical protein